MSSQASSGQSFSADTLGSLLSAQESSQSNPLQDAFATLDSDSDGALSTDELSSALSSVMGDSTDVSSAVDSLVSAADSDGDGAISGDEFTAMAEASRPQGPSGPPPSESADAGDSTSTSTSTSGGLLSGAGGSSTTSEVFDTLDTNEDGVVSAAELVAGDSTSTDATSAANTLFSSADADGDGSLSGDEFAEMLTKTQASASNDTTGGTSGGGASPLASDMMQKLLDQLASAQGSTQTRSVSIAA